LRKGSRGEGVKLLQQYLGAEPDGIFGPKTEKLLITYKKRERMKDVSGVLNFMTWYKLVK